MTIFDATQVALDLDGDAIERRLAAAEAGIAELRAQLATHAHAEPAPAPEPTPTPEPEPEPEPPTRLPALTRAYVDSLAKSGAAYDGVVAQSSLSDRPDLSDQDSQGSAAILARGLLGDHVGVAEDLAAALDSLVSVDRTLSLAREAQPLALAARLTGQDASVLLRDILALDGLSGRGVDNLRASARVDPTNWGTMARASVAWIAWGLDDPELIDEAWDNQLRYLTTGGEFRYRAEQQSWQPNLSPESAWVTVGPVGATRNGWDLDGVLTNDAYRGGDPPDLDTGYVWEGFQGTISAAIALDMAGHPEVWQVGDRAILRAGLWMHRLGVPATGDDGWIGWVLRRVYGAAWPHALASAPTQPGKGWAFTDWLYPVAP